MDKMKGKIFKTLMHTYKLVVRGNVVNDNRNKEFKIPLESVLCFTFRDMR